MLREDTTHPWLLDNSSPQTKHYAREVSSGETHMTHSATSRIRTAKYIVALIIAFIVLCGTKSTAAREPVLGPTDDPIELGTRRELFVDNSVIENLEGAMPRLQRPHDEGVVLKFDKPWEGRFCGYATVIHDGQVYRLYYRGLPNAGADGSAKEVSCYAESPDGIHWTKPALGLFEVKGTRENNVVLADMPPYSHNFCPMLDSRKDVPPAERYKALGGTGASGLAAFVSPDGIHWKKLRDEPVFTEGAFDSQNVPFWSEHEQCYLCYFRVFKDGIRRIARTTSKGSQRIAEIFVSVLPPGSTRRTPATGRDSRSGLRSSSHPATPTAPPPPG